MGAAAVAMEEGLRAWKEWLAVEFVLSLRAADRFVLLKHSLNEDTWQEGSEKANRARSRDSSGQLPLFLCGFHINRPSVNTTADQINIRIRLDWISDEQQQNRPHNVAESSAIQSIDA